MSVGAVFMMLQGDREAALDILLASYHLGQMMNKDDTILAHLIGIAVRAIATEGLAIYALNCCEKVEEVEQLWEQLERLEQNIYTIDRDTLFAYETPLGSLLPERYHPNYLEAMVRHNVTTAKFEILRTATAAWYRAIKQGKFPETSEDFASLLPEGPPADPFDSEPLKFRTDDDLFVCYSYGPDEKDNRAAFAYDPTNGTISPGDIFTNVPLQRTYPFPRDGIHASSAREVREIFARGLPRYPFASTRGKPFGISNTKPVMIYSFGPDANKWEAREQGKCYVPEVPYDPTNGTVSEGDLFMTVPTPDNTP